MISDALFRILARAGQWAPTAENRHCVKLRLSPAGIEIVADEAFWADAPGRRPLHYLGIGAVAENIVVRAAAAGYAADVEWATQPGRDAPLGRIGLIETGESAVAGGALAPFIEERRTNRSLRYTGPSLDAAERAALLAAVAGIPGDPALLLPQGAPRRELTNLAWLAESARFANPVLHRELFEGVRWDVGWHASAEVGLPPGALGIELPARPSFKALSHWPLARGLSRLGLHRVIGLRAARLPLALTPDLLVICGSRRDAVAWLDAGRTVQRCWLWATGQGKAVQPAAAVALYADPEFPGVPDALRARLIAGWQGILGERHPHMVLRIGRAPAPAVRASRPALSAFLLP